MSYVVIGRNLLFLVEESIYNPCPQSCPGNRVFLFCLVFRRYTKMRILSSWPNHMLSKEIADYRCLEQNYHLEDDIPICKGSELAWILANLSPPSLNPWCFTRINHSVFQCPGTSSWHCFIVVIELRKVCTFYPSQNSSSLTF